MSDYIIVNDKKYFEEGYLKLANANTKRAHKRIKELETLVDRLLAVAGIKLYRL